MSWIAIVLPIVFELIEDCSNDNDEITEMVYDESPLVRRKVNQAMRQANVPWRQRRDVREATLEQIYEASPAQIRAFCSGGPKAVNGLQNRTVTSDNGSSRIPVGV